MPRVQLLVTDGTVGSCLCAHLQVLLPSLSLFTLTHSLTHPQAQSGKMIADSSTDPEILCEAIHENHSEVDEFAFYHNASMGEVMDSHDQSLSNVETSATPR